MQDQKKGQSTGSTESKTGGSTGTKGRAEEQMQNRSDLPNTPTGDWTGAPREAITHQPGQERSEQAGMSQTSAMLREEQGHAGMQKQTGMQGQAGMEQRGSMGQTERGGTYGEQMRGWETGTERTTTRVTHGRGEQESEDAGMQQASMMLREAREEGDPEMQQREEDLHARQQNLGAREKSLGERDEQLRTREKGLRERQSKFMGKGLGATDYTNYQIQNTR